MTRFSEVKYRDCGYCGTVNVAMSTLWSTRGYLDASGGTHAFALFGCPRCGRATLVELNIDNHPGKSEPGIKSAAEVTETSALPRSGDLGLSVRHLPDDVKGFYEDAQRVLRAGVPDAAAVQLRKTLEASAAHKGVTERTLVGSIRKLVDAGYVTLDFKDVMTHIRKIGNTGAHYTDIRLTSEEVERSLRFTTQVLRNLFEVPGELAELAAETPEDPLETETDVGA